MKIARIEPIHVVIPFEHGVPHASEGMGAGGKLDILLVRVDTDEGVTGWGEAFSPSAAPVMVTALTRIIAPLAVGRDPTDIAGLMGHLWRATRGMSRNGPVAYALSGLDIALWDIKGKLAGAPLWKLLGGSGKPRVPAYASLLRIGRPDDVARVAVKALERGYRHIKLHEYTVEAVAAVRAAIGPDIPIMLDTNCHWMTVEDARAVAQKLAPHKLAWLEEPLFPPDDFEGLARLRREGGVPIAAGENLGNVLDLRRICEAGAVDVVQPSLAKMGGISEIVKAIADAQARGVRVVPHSPYSGPALAAAVHVLCAMPGGILCEHRYGDLAASPIGDAVLSRDGHLCVPDGPGLGIEVDQKAIETYRVA